MSNQALVFDASALIAYFDDEPGADIVEQHIPFAVMSAVNFAEVGTVLLNRGWDAAKISTDMRQCLHSVLPFDDTLATETFAMQKHTKPYGLSLGDRACLALAKKLRVPALTGDRAWAKLSMDVEVRFFRGVA